MKRYCFTVVCICLTLLVYAQDKKKPEGAAALPHSYRELSLGMGLDELKDALTKDALFNFQDSDVSFISSKKENIVETMGPSFIRRALFQLKDEQVFVMIFTLNTLRIDHYSIFTTLVQKYGEPATLDPKQAIWEDDAVRLSLERPLILKYVDKAVFNKVLDESKAKKNEEVLIREEFLDEF